ncbi:MAG: cytochrome c maturation protein CcmE [Thiotrichales bacterium]
MRARSKRMWTVSLLLIGVVVTAALLISAFRQNLMYFYTPTQIADGEAPIDRSVRVGGLVKEDTFKREDGTLTVNFVITDTAKDVTASYTGILPDLFREGQGIVARGKVNEAGIFMADEVLAKHDENYMPPEAADAMAAAMAAKTVESN